MYDQLNEIHHKNHDYILTNTLGLEKIFIASSISLSFDSSSIFLCLCRNVSHVIGSDTSSEVKAFLSTEYSYNNLYNNLTLLQN